MSILVNAIYEQGQLRLSEALDLPDGQRVQVQIEPIDDLQVLKNLLGNTVIWASDDEDNDAWIESQGDELRTRLSGTGNLSDMIVDDRDETS